MKKESLSFFLITSLFLFCIATPLYAAAAALSAGPNNPSVAANDGTSGTGWSAAVISNALSVDGNEADLTSALSKSSESGNVSKYLKLTGFGFTIPADATVVGIEVAVTRRGTSDSGDFVKDNSVILVGGAGVSADKATADAYTATLAATTYGGATDLWATTWTPAQINDASFGLEISVQNIDTVSSHNAHIDGATITIYYTITLPTIKSVDSLKGNGSYAAGVGIGVRVFFSELVSSNESLTVTLETGTTDGTCSIPAFADKTIVSCDPAYITQAGDTTSDLAAISVAVDNGGVVTNANGNVMTDFSIPTGKNISDTKNIIIDTTAPTTSVATSAASGNVKLGAIVTITATFNEPIKDTPAPVMTVSGVAADGPVSMTKTDATHYTYAYVADVGNGEVAFTALGAIDLAGNAQVVVGVAALTLDNIAPLIAPHADVGPIEATSGTGANVTYTNPSTSDTVDGASTASCLPTSGTKFAIGSTTVTCNATDVAGNNATSTTFAVAVQDTTAPIITLLGVTSDIGVGGSYTELGATAADAVDGAFASTPSGSVDTTTIGSYIITYNATDTHGNVANHVTRSVSVVDNIAPLIAPHADVGPIEATSGTGTSVTYTAPNATDNIDATAAASCSPISGTVFAVGSTIVTCNKSDTAGNAATPITFIVAVQDTTAPVVTLLGSASTSVALGNTYVDPGYSATDIVDGSVTPIVTGTVDTSVPSTYTLTTTATDAHNNSSAKTRDIIVSSLSLLVTTISNGDGTKSGTLTNAATSSATSNGVSVDVQMPSDMAITGPDGWDGTLTLPTASVVSLDSFNPPGLANHVGSAIAIGAKDMALTFDKGVRLLFAGKAGSLAGFTRGGVFTQITSLCISDNQAGGNVLAAGADCKIDVGANLVVWTKHFTDFVVYTQGPNPPTGSGGNSNGNSGNGAPVGGGGYTPSTLTLAKLAPVHQAPAPQGEVLGASKYRFTFPISFGSKGVEVSFLQQILINGGFLKISTPTGWFGPMTEVSLKKYQAKYGIPALGMVGPLTRARLNK